MNKNYEYKKLAPFKWFVLQNFPFIDEDFDALTNWQLFCKLGEEINKVIESQNLVGTQVEELTTAFNDLQDYVNNYFENLDVQDEINNKLDEMAKNGELQELIGKYLQLGAILTFNTVNDMINSESLVSGSVARTLGRSTINDRKGATYKIVTLMSHVADGINTISLGHDDLYAQLIYENKITTLDTLQTLKSATNLTKYDLIQTLGYNSINDGGNGFYYIVDELEEEESANNGNIVELQNNLYAKLIIENIINIKQFGAVGDNDADDTIAIRNAINYSCNNNYKKIYVPSGNYIITELISTKQSFNQPIIEGENVKTTNFKFTTDIASIKFKGGSGDLANSYLKNISFSGNGTNTLVQLEGVCGYELLYCRFNNCKIGILMHNNSSNEFTEYCVVKHSRFLDSCKTAIEYKKTNGTESFNGSGIYDCTMVQKSNETEYKIIIGENCLVYNAPLDFMCWKKNVNLPLIKNNANYQLRATFYGNIKLEVQTGNSQEIVDIDGSDVFLAGNVIVYGGYIIYTKLILVEKMQINPNKSISMQRKPYKIKKTLTTETTNLLSIDRNQTVIVDVYVNAPFYEYHYSLLVRSRASSETLGIATLLNGEEFNQADYGNASFGNSGRNLTITNSNYAGRNINCEITVTPLTVYE